MKIELRAAADSDKEFARQVHHAAYKDVVVRQFGSWNESLQDSFFEETWGAGEFRIINFDSQDVGVFKVCDGGDHIEIVEIQLLPEYQSRGIGSRVLQIELALAKQSRTPVRLRVLKANRAQALYVRLGFKLIGTNETHVFMQ